MPAADYDIFSLRSYSFAVRKTNSFFSLTTIIVSLIILTLSIILSLDTISHLWVPRSQVNIEATRAVAYPKPFTETLICYKPLDPFTGIPQAKLIRQNLTQIPATIIDQATAIKRHPSLSQSIGTGFACLNLQGYQFLDKLSKLYIEVMYTRADIYILGQSSSSIISQIDDTPILISNNYMLNTRMTVMISISYMQATINDKLYINYQPQKIFTIKTYDYLAGNILFKQNIAKPYITTNKMIALKNRIPIQSSSIESANYNIEQVAITRYDLAYILGTVLSWISILTLIAGFIISPVMNYALNLIIAQTLFHIQSKYESPSLFKLLIASVKSGIFAKEDYYLKLSEYVQELKDIKFSLKLQFLLQRLNQKAPKGQQSFVSANTFQNLPKQNVGIELLDQQEKPYEEIINTKDDQPKDGTFTKIRKRVLCYFDTGSDNISINFEGNGYGSNKSLCISLLFVCGFLAFLLIFGVFTFSSQTSKYQELGIDIVLDLDTTVLYVLYFGTSQLKAHYLDGNYNIISQVPFVSSDACKNQLLSRAVIQQYQLDRNPVAYCFTNSVTMKYSADPSSQILLRISNPNPIVDMFDQYFIYSFTNLINQDIVPIYYQNIIPSNANTFTGFTLFPIQVVHFANSTYDQQLSFIKPKFTQTQDNTAFGQQAYGAIFKLKPSVMNIITEDQTIFDFVQTLWSFSIVCFTVILIKITKYINIKSKEQKLSAQRSDYRDNICILLSKLHQLVHGRNKAELKAMKYYIKSPISYPA